MESFETYALSFYTSTDPNGKPMVDLYTYGVKAAIEEYREKVLSNTLEAETIKEIFYRSKTPLEMHLRLMAILYYLTSTDLADGDRKAGLQLLRAETYSVQPTLGPQTWQGNGKLTAPIMHLAGKLLSSMANESVVTDYAPIVPYVGTVRTQFSGVTMRPFPGVVMPRFDEEVKNLTESTGLVQKMTDIMMQPDRCLHCFWNIDELIQVYESGSAEMIAKIVNGEAMKVPSTVTTMMMLLCAYRQLLNGETSGVARVIRVLRTDELMKDMGTMESFLNDVPVEALEADLSAYTNHILENAQDLMGMTKIAHTPKAKVEVDKETFDLTNLRNFIGAARRYRTNLYSNQAFSGFSKVASISYVDNFTLIQPELPDGTTPFCYVPLIDDLRGSRVVFARITRGSSDIDFFTEEQLNEIMKNHTPKPAPVTTMGIGDPTELDENDDSVGINPRIIE